MKSGWTSHLHGLDGPSGPDSTQTELYAFSVRERRYELTGGRLENQEVKHIQGAAVRVLAPGGRMGFAFRRDSRLESVKQAVAEARHLAAQAEPDDCRQLPPPRPATPVTPASRVDLQGILPAAKVDLVFSLEAAAKAVDPRIRAVHQAAYREVEIETRLLNSLGLDLTWQRQEFSLSLAVLAEDRGESQLAEEFRTWPAWNQIDPALVGAAAAHKAVRLLGARPLPTGRRSLLLPPEVSAALLEAVFPAWSAEAVQRGRSFLAGQEGKPLGPECLHLVDDGTLAQALGSAPTDEEGSPTQRTELLRSGRVAGFLHNHETALRGNTRSTGNARRPGMISPPGIGPTNVLLLPADQGRPPAELARLANHGLQVAEVLGLHTLDPVSGEYSLGANGWLLQDGEPGQAVRSVTIAGRLGDLFQRIEAVGQDVTAYDRFSAPTLLAADIMVAGT